MARRYELVYVVSPEGTDDQITEIHQQVEATVRRMGGQIDRTENWGRRKLAYEIGRHKEGTYVLEAIDGDGEVVKEIDRRLRVTDLVIRHLIVRIDEEQRVAAHKRDRRSETSRRRRVARGLPPDRQAGEGQRGEADDDRDDRFDVGEELR
jgi:small subunit ribosomal protein S6